MLISLPKSQDVPRYETIIIGPLDSFPTKFIKIYLVLYSIVGKSIYFLFNT